MILARVLGNVITSARVDNMEGAVYKIVSPCTSDGSVTQGEMVALDLIGAAPDEFVIVSQGSSTRQTEFTKDKPVDAVIMGIVDIVEEEGKVVFQK
ncbi:MAG: EutN/CcmL family microcompartment protein [Spirochaetaceae bacterium]|nr:EutN/CcmL family microcompartment protein [Spirochaetaceae bacterium]